MSNKEQTMQQLIAMSHWLGEESRGFAILGEGNTSGKIGDDSFYVKASGAQLSNISERGIVEVSFSKVLDMLDGPALTDAEIKARLKAATLNNDGGPAPSIETLFHAYLLSLPGVNFIGHTHPISVNSITCSSGWKQFTSGRLFPDEIVCCGIAPVYIDYTDPGVTLARTIKESVESYVKQYGERPKSVLMQNHGLIAVGGTVSEVQSITAMWDKTAKVLAGTFQFGGPNYMTAEAVDRIYTRPDELDRKKLIEGLNRE
ncbi:MAG: class II aldolase/adducin family protein [Armatimonadota bacterium]|nr:class II aldolase/adducin family protein [bacterium]